MPTACDPCPGKTQASVGRGSASGGIDPRSTGTRSAMVRLLHECGDGSEGVAPGRRRACAGSLVQGRLLDDDGFAVLVVAAGRAGVMGESRVVALRAGDGVHRGQMDVAPALPLTRLGVFAFWQRRHSSV